MPINGEIVEDALALQVLEAALVEVPRFREFGPRLMKVPLRGGATFMLAYKVEPARDDPDAWEFQNKVVKGYRAKLGG